MRVPVRSKTEMSTELWLQGWTSENDTTKDPMYHYETMLWRAPAKREGKLGRKYTTTYQAYSAMIRGNTPTAIDYQI